ncbi:MAG: chemotaxis protein CheW [Gemmatimonadetes bacterium]|nr:chemotaxis protein CheW [Gemmatimonadota bacterium]
MTPYDAAALQPDGLEEDESRQRVEDPGRGLLTVTLGQARFGLWVDEVLEILRTPPITRLPLSAAEVAGVTSVRGVVVPVLDLGQRLLGAPAQRPGRLVLIRHEASGSMVGLLVDDVGTLLGVRGDEVRPPPAEAEAELPPGLVTGVVAGSDGLVTVLHIGEAAAPPRTSTED